MNFFTLSNLAAYNWEDLLSQLDAAPAASAHPLRPPHPRPSAPIRAPAHRTRTRRTRSTMSHQPRPGAPAPRHTRAPPPKTVFGEDPHEQLRVVISSFVRYGLITPEYAAQLRGANATCLVCGYMLVAASECEARGDNYNVTVSSRCSLTESRFRNSLELSRWLHSLDPEREPTPAPAPAFAPAPAPAPAPPGSIVCTLDEFNMGEHERVMPALKYICYRGIISDKLFNELRSCRESGVDFHDTNKFPHKVHAADDAHCFNGYHVVVYDGRIGDRRWLTISGFRKWVDSLYQGCFSVAEFVAARDEASAANAEIAAGIEAAKDGIEKAIKAKQEVEDRKATSLSLRLEAIEYLNTKGLIEASVYRKNLERVKEKYFAPVFNVGNETYALTVKSAESYLYVLNLDIDVAYVEEEMPAFGAFKSWVDSKIESATPK